MVVVALVRRLLYSSWVASVAVSWRLNFYETYCDTWPMPYSIWILRENF